MSGGKDTFEMLVDEITLIRHEIKTLQRTSLDKDEAETLHSILVKSVERMATVGSSVQKQIEASLASAITDVRSHAVEAAGSAAREAILKSHTENLKVAKSYSKAAGEARREAWRYSEGSGSGWPLSALWGPFWAGWRSSGCKAVRMRQLSGNIRVSIADPQVVKLVLEKTDVGSVGFGSIAPFQKSLNGINS